MSDITISDDFVTNGVTVPAGRVTSEDLKQLFPVGEGDKKRPMTDDEVKAMQQDLLRRQGERSAYMKGIHEKRSYTKDSGSMAVGGGAE